MGNKSILELDSNGIFNFFLETENYCSIDLPQYVDFSNILNFIKDEFEGSNGIDDFVDIKKTTASYDANYCIYANKDGKYDWRPLTILHPVLYVNLAKTISDNWGYIKKRLIKLRKCKYIECVSIPISTSGNRTSREYAISNWWSRFEQKSVSMSLEYDYMLNTDISNCYGSLYTHTIAWALHSKKTGKKKRGNKNLCGNKIDFSIQMMQNGQTNGIPQGSVIMDFIAEVVLAYTDKILDLWIRKSKIKCKILRYRDDYNIFIDSQSDGRKIVKKIAEILQDLNFKLNAKKTFESDNIITSSIKKEKFDLIINDNSNKNLEKHILFIYDYACKFPNSGQLFNMLKEYYKIILEQKAMKTYEMPIIATTVEIAYRNPRVYSQCIAIISKIIDTMNESERKIIFSKIEIKFKKQPNSDLVLFWMHRLTLPYLLPSKRDPKKCTVTSFKRLFESDGRKNPISLWDTKFIKKTDIREKLKLENMFDYEIIRNLKPVFKEDEFGLFNDYI